MKNHQIWARLGCRFTMTEAEREQLLAAKGSERRHELFETMIQDHLRRGGLVLDGEAYSPGNENPDANPLGEELVADFNPVPIHPVAMQLLCVKAENHVEDWIVGSFKEDEHLFPAVKHYVSQMLDVLSEADRTDFEAIESMDELIDWCENVRSQILYEGGTAYRLEWVEPASAKDLL